MATALAFACFVAMRSIHPIAIDLSKTDGQLLYGKATPVVVNSAVDIVLGNTIGLAAGGVAGLRQCWDPRSMKVFSVVATLYAFGDVLEMQSMSLMGGACPLCVCVCVSGR